MRVKSVVVHVSDHSAARAFYTRVFGFQTKVDVPMGSDDSGDHWLEMALPDDSVRLVLSPPAGARHFGQQVGGWTNIIFSVDDLDRTIEAMRDAGAIITEEPCSFEWGRWAEVADPDGNRFGLSEMID